MERFNGLTNAEDERLTIIAEECAEVIQAVMKIKRHGFNSWNPDANNSRTNREELAREIGHVMNATRMLREADDIDFNYVENCAALKAHSIGRYLHHQDEEDENEG